MEQPEKLTIEEVERRGAFSRENPFISPLGDIWQQLADTMRENERLREALEHYRAADDSVYQMMAGFHATKDMHDPNSIAGNALDSSRHSDTGKCSHGWPIEMNCSDCSIQE